MGNKNFDVLGIGNAIVDLLFEVDDAAISELGVDKGSMNLIEESRSKELLSRFENATIASGGSVANSTAGVSSFGGSAGFLGRVSSDELGGLFNDGMKRLGVSFLSKTSELTEEGNTGSSIILITPDSQRTMNTHLGVAGDFSLADIDQDAVKSSKFLLCEGYLWDKEPAKEAIRSAIDITKQAGNSSVLTLSDTFCVERHRDEFVALIENQVDVVFANGEELASLYRCDLELAVKHIQKSCPLAYITVGERGSLVVSESEVLKIEPEEVETVVDTTGAGDQYAAGVLYGLSQGLAPEVSGRLGSLAAAEVISHVGPRPHSSYTDFLRMV